ncbi:4-amino-4-deoxy-L-arabinose transferase-like glycosyltransferase [Saccharothrix tamanrassetensis]|uniref:4-amino-4-deoxy-L-arabinose transferase-like glycosyltransferase n=1 Tax=Saccharothrix tamanrassetensis TaxID=1051531 RepID=A0A841CRB7_9PSEU|nr:glycosyltransferase family 39 protein [Saccharothrix tamanrassetensis]MBB5959433.1 4-amino-4-deoxy-L-arabinose transferase-like glycosyltransferase [Saccharothrix tamanrassetensis]
MRARLPLLLLLAGTAVLYLWRLGDSGWANAYYSAAAQAGAQSWQAWFFGSTDAANSITVDKTPAATWVMGLSARLFGVNAWSILVPQALMGVASVGLLYAAVKRVAGEAAGLIAGAVLALTPVAVLMFRFNNPDALLVLLLIAGAYCTVRATGTASWKWLALAGVAVGFAFLTKMLQAFLVLPAFGLVYLLAAPTAVRKKAWHLAVASGAMVVAGGWWVLAVELVPAGSRPHIGGSQSDSVLELALGYNGLGRLTGDEVGSVGGGRGWGSAGWSRLLGAEMGSQIAWLLPTAVVLLIAGFWAADHRRRTGLALWGGWLVVTAVVFSFMNGIIHAYYTVALAPAIGAIIGIGATALWRRRQEPGAAAALSGALAITALQCYLLLLDWSPGLAAAVLVLGLLAAVGLFLSTVAPAAVVVPIAVVAALLGPGAYSVATAATPHSGAVPSAGPDNGMRGGGGLVLIGPGGGRDGGGLLSAPTPDVELVGLLRENSGKYRWGAAAVGSNNAAGYQLGSGVPVMAVGGFNGTDPAPTLEEFQEHVRSGHIHYFLGGAGMPAETGSDASERIAEWVQDTFEAVTVGGVDVYDLTAGAQR